MVSFIWIYSLNIKNVVIEINHGWIEEFHLALLIGNFILKFAIEKPIKRTTFKNLINPSLTTSLENLYVMF